MSETTYVDIDKKGFDLIDANKNQGATNNNITVKNASSSRITKDDLPEGHAIRYSKSSIPPQCKRSQSMNNFPKTHNGKPTYNA
jgi:hypothetical protein